ncbi:MAG: hypothetical protein SF097_20530 [Acidobacteriota bacterium]|nr:hypothetical protein [Acidobacteriota bacterium]
MKKTLLVLIAIVCLSFVVLAQTPKQVVTVLKGLDPVELVNGKEVQGLENLSVTRVRYRYLFVNEANKRAFEKSPADYQIQFGGGCGQMGSLSGAGNPDRFHVFNKHIYIFASESCRNSFKKNPDAHIETADAIPTGTDDEKKRGQELIALALKGFGGMAKVDGIKNYQAKFKLGYKQGDKVLEYPQTLTIAFPGNYRNEYNWGSSLTGDVLLPTGAVSMTTKNSESDAWKREEPVKAALERALYREPLAILKSRKEKGFVVFAAGKTEVGNTEVELLKVAFKGATTTLGIDPKTGQVLQTSYSDRKGAYGDVVKIFSDFRAVDGLLLPFGVAESFNGKPVASPMVSVESIAINGKLDAKTFRVQ